MDKNIIKNYLKSFVSEAVSPTPATTPAIKLAKKIGKENEKENKAGLKAIAKDMESYEKPLTSVDPNQKEMAPNKYDYEGNTEKDYHDQMEIMNGQEMIQYDRKPSSRFAERAIEAIEGSSNMGNNPEWANVVQNGWGGNPEFGKNLVKKVKASEKKRSEQTPTSKMFGDDWEVVEFPAIIEDKQGNEASLWPEFWPLEELQAKKAALDVRYWNAQYLQNPVSEEGALIKREWWQIWDNEVPPSCEFTIMSLDAAQEANTRADYNSLTTWGVFFNEETNNYNIILLNAIKERLEFPELKELVLREYKEWEPDALIVEKKSNGAALYQEMRRMGIPLGEFTPGKGQDKISRVNSVADLFRSGIVWAPDKRWAHELIEECNDFPSGANDDQVDSTTMALMRFRQGGFIRLPNDEPEDIAGFRSSRNKLYLV